MPQSTPCQPLSSRISQIAAQGAFAFPCFSPYYMHDTIRLIRINKPVTQQYKKAVIYTDNDLNFTNLHLIPFSIPYDKKHPRTVVLRCNKSYMIVQRRNTL